MRSINEIRAMISRIEDVQATIARVDDPSVDDDLQTLWDALTWVVYEKYVDNERVAQYLGER